MLTLLIIKEDIMPDLVGLFNVCNICVGRKGAAGPDLCMLSSATQIVEVIDFVLTTEATYICNKFTKKVQVSSAAAQNFGQTTKSKSNVAFFSVKL